MDISEENAYENGKDTRLQTFSENTDVTINNEVSRQKDNIDFEIRDEAILTVVIINDEVSPISDNIDSELRHEAILTDELKNNEVSPQSDNVDSGLRDEAILIDGIMNNEVSRKNDIIDSELRDENILTDVIINNEVSPQRDDIDFELKDEVILLIDAIINNEVSRKNDIIDSELRDEDILRDETINNEVSRQSDNIDYENPELILLTEVTDANNVLRQSNEEVKPTHKNVLRSLATWKEICWKLFSFVAYVCDVGSDVILAVNYYNEKEYLYCTLTALFIYLPVLSMILTIMNWKGWSIQEKCKVILPVILLLYPLEIMLRELYYTVKYFLADSNEDIRKMYQEKIEETRIVNCMLKVLESMLECAPQLSLQLAITLSTKSLSISQAISIVTSFLAMPISIVSYYFAKRDGYLDKIKLFLYYLLIIVPRILSMCVLASVQPTAAAVACALHVTVITVLYITYDYSEDSKISIATTTKSFILGVISVFNPDLLTSSNVPPFSSKSYYYTYHTISYLENVLAVTVWAWRIYLTDSQSWYSIPLVVFCAMPYNVIMAVYIGTKSKSGK